MENACPPFPSSATSHTSSDPSFQNSQTETERWFQLRNDLLGEKKFAKIMDEISEAEWIQSRTDSFKAILDCCSNFHGGPTGEMWNTITNAVKNHFGPNHELVSLVANYRENVWATCSLVTVTTLSGDTSLDSKSALEVNELQESSSMPSSSHKSYGSVHLIQPSWKGNNYALILHIHSLAECEIMYSKSYHK